MAEEQLEQNGSVSIPDPKPILDAEWCFQFFDNEPVIFGFNKESQESGNLVLELKPNEGEALTFKQSGMTFRIFPRPISEKTKSEREKLESNDI